MTAITATGTTRQLLGLGFERFLGSLDGVAGWAPRRRAHLPAGDRPSVGAPRSWPRPATWKPRRRPAGCRPKESCRPRRRRPARTVCGPRGTGGRDRRRLPAAARGQAPSPPGGRCRGQRGQIHAYLPANQPFSVRRSLQPGDDPRPVPSRCQRRNNPCTVCLGPSRDGASRHRAPVRTRQRIPSISCRFPHTGGGLSRGGCGSTSASAAHCASLRSPRPTRR